QRAGRREIPFERQVEVVGLGRFQVRIAVRRAVEGLDIRGRVGEARAQRGVGLQLGEVRPRYALGQGDAGLQVLGEFETQVQAGQDVGIVVSGVDRCLE